MPKVKVNDIAMYYEIHGQGEPVVFVAGFSADHLAWGDVLNQFKQKYKVILLDNRGAGQTDIPTSDYNIKQMAADIAELCKLLEIDNAHFVGSSMGGYIVQQLAYDYPALIKSLVISNSAMSTRTPFHFYVEAQYELIKANAPFDAIIKASCAWCYSYKYLSQPGIFEELKQYILQNPYPFTLPGYKSQYAALDAFDSSEWANKIEARTLVIGANEDIILPHKLAEALAKEIPHSTYYCFEECGHLPFVEQPEKFVSVLNNFWSNL